MAIVLLKNMTHEVNIIEQQQVILRYATARGISIQSTEIETSDPSLTLEDRKELKGFLRSLENDAVVLVYDLWALSSKVDELVKIFECLLKRDITLHLCHQDKIVASDATPLSILTILADQREANMNPRQQIAQGRPKGRMSKSKFDIHRSRVIEMLEEGASVSEIAKELDVSRSSLKDYINSRGLKELAHTKKTLLHATPVKLPPKLPEPEEECELITEEATELGN